MSSKGKQYKNVYTILEKVRKGEIESHYKTSDGLFGKIDFYKRPDLIKPHMHYLDESRLESVVKSHIFTGQNIQNYYKKFMDGQAGKISDQTKRPDFAVFAHKVQENFEKFPKHMMRDIHKMFYHKIDHLEFEERTDKTHSKFRFLERANNPVAKIMTQNSGLKSSIFTRNLMLHYMVQMTAMEYIDPEGHQKLQQSLKGEGSEFDSKDLDKALSNMLDNKHAQEQLEKALKDAQEICKELDQNVPEEVQEQMFNQANSRDSEAGKLSQNYLKQVAANLQQISLSMGSLKERIKKLLDKTTSYFSANEIVTYEDLFNSDNLAGLDDYEPLHPKLRKFMVEDVMIKNTKRVGKIDVYIDISGSMSSECGARNIQGHHISKLDFCKSFTAKLSELNMLNDVYLFDTQVKKYRNDIVSIAMIGCGGGTSIDAAVHHIERVGNNAIVITDAEDRCHRYSDKTFFIGVKGSNFRHFDADVIEKYSEQRQVVVFTGTNILQVNTSGNTV